MVSLLCVEDDALARANLATCSICPGKMVARYWAKVFISPHRDAAGALNHFITVVDDVTERRRLEPE